MNIHQESPACEILLELFNDSMELIVDLLRAKVTHGRLLNIPVGIALQPERFFNKLTLVLIPRFHSDLCKCKSTTCGLPTMASATSAIFLVISCVPSSGQITAVLHEPFIYNGEGWLVYSKFDLIQ